MYAINLLLLLFHISGSCIKYSVMLELKYSKFGMYFLTTQYFTNMLTF